MLIWRRSLGHHMKMRLFLRKSIICSVGNAECTMLLKFQSIIYIALNCKVQIRTAQINYHSPPSVYPPSYQHPHTHTPPPPHPTITAHTSNNAKRTLTSPHPKLPLLETSPSLEEILITLRVTRRHEKARRTHLIYM